MSLDLILSPRTRALIDVLRLVPLGDVVTYATLSATLGENVQKTAAQALASARRIVERDEGIVFQVVRKVGLRRIHADEAPDIGTAARRKMNRASRRAVQTMTRAAHASNGLSPDAQRRLSAEVSAHGLLQELTRDAAVDRLQEKGKVVGPALVAQSFIDHLGLGKRGGQE
jgi:hypothetical protein